MEEEIKIKGSKLSLIRVAHKPYFGLDIKVEECTKKHPEKINILLFLTRGNPSYGTYSSTNHIDKYAVDNSSLREYEECWYISEGESINSFSENEYTIDEKKIIATFILFMLKNHSLLINNLDIVEDLLVATNEKRFIKKFYNNVSNSDPGLYTYKIYLELFIKNNDVSEEKYSLEPEKIRKIYTKKTEYGYSVVNLLEDLVSDPVSEILISKGISYERISKRTVSEHCRDVESGVESWHKILKIVRNKVRANLSISYASSVVVDIPSNKFGIDPGKKIYTTTKNICIVEDGNIHIRLLCVKVSPELSSKLKNIDNLVVSELCNENELVLNLHNIPVITYDRISDKNIILPVDLAKLEVESKRCLIALNYLRFIRSELISPKKKFLEDLGIYKHSYHSDMDISRKEKEKSPGERETSTVPCGLCAKIDALNFSKKDKTDSYMRYYHSDSNANIITKGANLAKTGYILEIVSILDSFGLSIFKKSNEKNYDLSTVEEAIDRITALKETVEETIKKEKFKYILRKDRFIDLLDIPMSFMIEQKSYTVWWRLVVIGQY